MKDVESYYDKKSRNYDDVFDALYFKIYDAVTWRYIEPYLPRNHDALVLDAGGGTGRWAIRMAKEGYKAVLMDISEEMLKLAAEKVQKGGLQERVAIEKGDIVRMKYADNTFDMILCEHTLFVFQKPDTALKELKRVLKKGGCLIISAQNRYVQSLATLSDRPCLENLERALGKLLTKKRDCMTEDGKVTIYSWTPDEFRIMLEMNGFRVEKIIGKGVTMPLRIESEFFVQKDYSADLFDRLLEFELALCEKTDALALAGHMQAIAFKQ